MSLLCALTTAAAAACPGDPVNQAPTASAQAVATDEDTAFSGNATGTDPEGAALTYALVTAPSLGLVSLSASGAFLYTPSPHAHGADRFTFKANDGVNDSPPAEVQVTVRPVNDAPHLASAGLGPGPFRTEDTLTVLPSGWSDVDGDAEGYRFQWFVNAVAVSGATTSTLPGQFFSRGDAVRCAVTPFDGKASGAAVTSPTVSIQNTAPAVGSASLGAGPHHLHSVLTCAPSSVADADGDPVGFSFDWFVNDTLLAAEHGPTLAGPWNGGDTVRCRVTPSDGTDSGAAVTSSPVRIVNTAPSLASVTVVGGTPRTQDVLSCIPEGYSDAEGSPPGYLYAWLRNGTVLSGQTARTLDGRSSFSRGDAIACRVTPTDGVNLGAPVTSSAVTILNSAPEVGSVSLGSGPFRTSEVLTCTGSGLSDVDGDAVAVSFQWFLNWVELGGAVTATLDGATHFDRGDAISCAVTPHDGREAGATVTSLAVTIANTAPTLLSASLGAGPYRTDDTLSCTASGFQDADGDAPLYAYAWFKNGVELPGQTASMLDGASQFDVGDALRCRVTPSDGTASGAPVESDPVTIQPPPHTVTGASLGEGPYFVTSTLRCSPNAAGDPDATYTYAWSRNGDVVPGWTQPVLDGSHLRKGDSLFCRLGATDGTGTTTFTSNTVIIQNSPPVTSPAHLALLAGTSASGRLSATDPDGDPVVGYALASGSAHGTVVLTDSATGAFTFTADAAYRGEASFSFTATDGFDTSAPGTASVRVHEKRLARGEMYGCAIAADRTLRCWGGNDAGQLGNDTLAESSVPVQEARGFSDWASVATGGVGPWDLAIGHTCAIRLDGSLWCWGSNRFGQLGLGNSVLGNVTRPTLVDAGRWVEVALGYGHSCGIKQDGSLWCWGLGSHGATGLGVPGGIHPSPVRVGTGTDWATLAAGDIHTCAIPFDGTLWCWGQGGAYALGDGAGVDRTVPTQESTRARSWVQVEADSQRTLAVRADGTLWGWGRVGVSAASPFVQTPRQLDTGWREVAPGPNHYCGLKTGGTLYCRGPNAYGALGLGLDTTVSGAGALGTETGWVEVASGRDGSCARKGDGSTWCWGDNLLGQTATGTDQSHLVPTPVGTASWSQVAVRAVTGPSPGSGTCAIRTDGTLWCAGFSGTEGSNSRPMRKAFSQPAPGVSTWASTGAGMYHACATRTDGSLWCWGDGFNGELGNGQSWGNTTTPVRVGSALDWAQGRKDLGAGARFTCARKTDSALYCWGDNEYGQLGLGDRLDRDLTTRVSGTSTWSALSVGATHACGLQTDGSLWCWGSNRWGQLGVHPGTSDNTPQQCGSGSFVGCGTSPQRVGAATDWTKVAAGGGHTCALNAAGTLSCWGKNDAGQLGGGGLGPQVCGKLQPRDCNPEPVQVGDGFADVWAGKGHTCARKLTGQLLCWGLNDSGQVGDGTLLNRLSPVELDSGSGGWLDGSAGDDFSCAVRDGAGGTRPLWCWGRSRSGGFGDDHGWKLTPVRTLLP